MLTKRYHDHLTVPCNSTKDDKKIPIKRNREEAFNSPNREVQKEVLNQIHKFHKLCSLIEKPFTLMVEKQSLPSRNL